jgi:hypothetical protein
VKWESVLRGDGCIFASEGRLDALFTTYGASERDMKGGIIFWRAEPFLHRAIVLVSAPSTTDFFVDLQAVKDLRTRHSEQKILRVAARQPHADRTIPFSRSPRDCFPASAFCLRQIRQVRDGDSSGGASMVKEA